MAGAIAKRKENARIPALAMANRFSKYAPEAEKSIRTAEVTHNPVLDAMKKVFWSVGIGYNRRAAPNYKDLLEAVKTLEYTAKDVGLFSLVLPELEKEQNSRKRTDFESGAFGLKAGLFLSALINNGKEQEYVLHIPADIRLERLAYRNTKNITISGNTGIYCGQEMKGGSITINGDAGICCGKSLRGGSITINGNAATSCGECMKAGSITVNGNADLWCGQQSSGGTITVNGDAGEDLGMYMYGSSIIVKGNVNGRCGRQMRGGDIIIEGDMGPVADTFVVGRIFHKGVLIVDK
jgi:glutamate synthase domain-containing protein 3